MKKDRIFLLIAIALFFIANHQSSKLIFLVAWAFIILGAGYVLIKTW